MSVHVGVDGDVWMRVGGYSRCWWVGWWVSRHGPLHKAVSQTGPCSSTVTPLNHMHAAQLWRLLSLCITSSSSPSFSDIHLKSFSLGHDPPGRGSQSFHVSLLCNSITSEKVEVPSSTALLLIQEMHWR